MAKETKIQHQLVLGVESDDFLELHDFLVFIFHKYHSGLILSIPSRITK